MFNRFKLEYWIHVFAILFCASTLHAQSPTITTRTPERFTMDNTASVDISVQFDQAMAGNSFTATTFFVYGEKTGFHTGVYTYDAGSQTTTFSATDLFESGERVTAILTQGVTNSGGTPLAASYQWSFFIRTATGSTKLSLDSTYTTGKAPHYVAVGDVDGDADMDVAIANSKSPFTVDIWNNDGAANYNITETLNVGNTPLSINLGDFNADGSLDAVVGNQNDNTISVFRNDGTGAYTLLGTKTTATEPVWETSGDLDGDGYLDLVVVNLVSNSISVFINNSDGTFQNKVDYGVGTAPESAVLADFDNDGDPDVVITSISDNRITLMINNGAGVFGGTQTFNTGQSPRVVVAQDYNSDGKIDIATCNRDGDTVSLLLNNGGTFALATNFAVDATPFSITSGDFDGDLDADIVVSSRDSSNFTILINNGSGSFQTDSTYSTGVQPRALNSGDFNGDGVLDIAVANRNSNTLQIFLNTATGPVNATPAAPTLNSPAANVHLNPNTTPIVLNWKVPGDSDGDVLHFLVEISSTSDFSSIVDSADSRNNSSGFSPAPPVAQGAGSVSYSVSTNLTDGDYYWRVTAHDSTAFGSAATARQFTIDTIAPNIDTTSLKNPAPAALPSWYNQNNVASVDFQVQYDETNADRAVFDLGTLGGTQTVTGIAGGLDQSASIQVNINGIADGSYPLSVTVFDSAGNQAADSTASIALDSTPPSGTIASSPSSSQTLSFTVSWSGATDGTGSGISGNYDVQVQEDGGAWTAWKSDFSGTSDTFTGEQGKTYGFEAAAYDKVDNIAAFRDSAETTTVIDTSADNTPPSAPINLTAGGSNPSPWQNISDFVISWQNPADPSGIARSLYKRGAAPTSNFDITGVVEGATTVNINATAENGQKFYLWLEDNSNNVDFNNYAVVNLRYDATLPTGTNAISPANSVTELFTVSWAGGSDSGSGLSGLYNIHVQVEDKPWQVWLTDTNVTSAEYQGQHGKKYGFEVAAHDSAGNVEAFTQVAESTTQVDTSTNDVTAPGPPINLLAEGANPSPWQNDPVFLVSWQLPNDPSGIGRGFYKLGSAPSAKFDTTGSIVSGTSMQVSAIVEDGQPLFLWFEDQRGNMDFNNYGKIVLRFDETLPAINKTKFLNAHFDLNWLNQNLANDVKVYLEYSEKHVQRVELTSTTLDTTAVVPNPASGNEVPAQFDLSISGRSDGTYQINLTVADSAGNVERDSIDLHLDGSPPTGASATSPETSQNRTFTVTWTGTGTDSSGSGLSGVYDVRMQQDGGVWSDWITDFTGTSSDFPGVSGSVYSFEVLAHDNVGNIEVIRNVAETTTLVDTSFADSVPPTIAHTPPLLVNEGDDITVAADVQDNSQVENVKLYYRQSGMSTFQSMAMTQVSGSTYSATITASKLGTLGINYYIEATDGNNLQHNPATNWDTLPYNISVRISGTDGQGLVRSSVLPGGEDASNYRMISVPLNPDNPDPMAVLSDDLGTYKKKKWRLYQYDTVAKKYKEYPNVDDFTPGNVLWLIVKDAGKIIDAGVGTTVATNESFEITLKKGWNDIGHPFTFPVARNNVDIPNGVVGPYEYSNQWVLPSLVTSLKPWGGYSFLSDVEGLKITIHPNAASSQSKASTNFDYSSNLVPDWSLGIQAYCGKLSDEFNRIGVAAGASTEWDRLDYPEPPFISDYVAVRFYHPEWNKFGGVFKTDFRPQFDDGQVWSFAVVTTLKDEPIELYFPGLETLPDNFKVILLDHEYYRKIDLDKSTGYEFIPEQTGLSRKFDLVIGTQSFIEQSETLDNFVPETFSLSQNFPNPFNGGTTLLYKIAQQSKVSITVMNILGQEIRTLVNVKLQPGVFRIHWDGSANNGLEVSSGVYFIRLTAGKFQQIRKVLYIR